MWVELIRSLAPEAELAAPASPASLDAAEGRLGRRIPDALRQLLLETDGAAGEDLERAVWSVSVIVEENLSFRSNPNFRELYASFDDLLFFGDNGGGDQFAYRPSVEDGIFVWVHETDKRFRVADDLADYLHRILTSDGDDWYLPG